MSRDPTIKNVVLLALCQALAMSCMSLSMTSSALVGQSLAPDPSLVTIPLALQYVGTLIATMPASFSMKRFGRRIGLSLGAGLGLLSGLIAAAGIYIDSFWIFAAGSLILGFFNGHVLFYRFAAADTASEAFRSRAISLVLAGGLLAAFIGPELAKQTRDLFEPALFAGGYASVSVLSLLSIVLLQFIRIPRPARSEARSGGRPIGTILRQPAAIVAIFCGMVGYGAMNIIMVSTPMAMVANHHPFESAALVIQWHLVGMYLPSFFTGSIIHRIGVIPVLAGGALLILAAIGVNLSGIQLPQFLSALVLLGVGWNFLYIGGSTLLTECYSPRGKSQGSRA